MSKKKKTTTKSKNKKSATGSKTVADKLKKTGKNKNKSQSSISKSKKKSNKIDKFLIQQQKIDKLGIKRYLENEDLKSFYPKRSKSSKRKLISDEYKGQFLYTNIKRTTLKKLSIDLKNYKGKYRGKNHYIRLQVMFTDCYVFNTKRINFNEKASGIIEEILVEHLINLDNQYLNMFRQKAINEITDIFIIEEKRGK